MGATSQPVTAAGGVDSNSPSLPENIDSAGQSLTVVLTGGTGAIGGAIAEGLAVDGRVATLVLLVRSEEKGEALAQKLKGRGASVIIELIDLSSPCSIKECALRLAKVGRIDVLINNAGLVPTTRQVSTDGLEVMFASNTLAYFGLMRGLLPFMPKGGRIVNVTAALAGGLDVEDLQNTRSYHPRQTYAKVKQAQRMLTAEAVKPVHGFTEAGVLLASVHPGVTESDLGHGLGDFGPPPMTAEQCAAAPLFLALNDFSKQGSGLHWMHPNGPFGVGGAPVPFLDQWAGEHFAMDRVALWDACDQVLKNHERGPKAPLCGAAL